MIKVPGIDEQSSLIREMEFCNPINVVEPFFVISNLWFRNWKRYVGYRGLKPVPVSPGPIKNETLLMEDGTMKKNLTYGQDFEVVHQIIWDLFSHWYGGGPVIPIEVGYDPARKKNVPVIRKTNFQVCVEDSCVTVSFSKYKKVRELLILACSKFGLDPDKHVLRDFWNRKLGQFLDNNKIICEYSIADGQEIIIVSGDHPFQSSTENENEQNTNSLCKKSSSLIGISELSSPTPAPEPGLSGLQNMGNSCYMTSSLQCLFHTPPLVNFFIQDDWVSKINKDSCGVVTSNFYLLLKAFWTGQASFLNPHDFKTSMARLAPQFEGFHMHDAQEFLIVLLKLMHDDLNQNHGVSISEDPNAIFNPEKAIEQMKMKDNSIIIDWFFGLMRNQMYCTHCHETTVLYEPYITIPIPIPARGSVEIQFTFIPADPNEPKVHLQMSVLENFSKEEFFDSLSIEIGRKVFGAFAECSIDLDSLRWISLYRNPSKGHQILVFEVLNPNSLHTLMWPCLCLGNRFKRRNIVVDTPFVVEIYGEGTNETQIQEIAEEYFNFFWQQPKGFDSRTHADEIMELKDRIQPLKRPTNRKLRVKLEKSLFSKTMRFKPEPECPFIAKRSVRVTLNPEFIAQHQYPFNWYRIKRQIRQVHSFTKKPASVSIERCLEDFIAPQQLDENNRWECSQCQNMVCASQRSDIWSLPPILILHLKRFINMKGRLVKSDINVHYPFELDLSQYISTYIEKTKYKLYAVSEHTGSLNSGHYVARVYNHSNQKWYLFNDTSVKVCSPKSVQTPNAYLLFYERI